MKALRKAEGNSKTIIHEYSHIGNQQMPRRMRHRLQTVGHSANHIPTEGTSTCMNQVPQGLNVRAIQNSYWNLCSEYVANAFIMKFGRS